LARSDVEFQKLGLMGLTVIIACGDSGAGDLGDPPEESSCSTTLHADWPSQSPYVVALGTTYITPNDKPICYFQKSEGGEDCNNPSFPLGEVAVSLDQGFVWTTGGGFSNVTSRPDYQAAVVEQYLNQSAHVLPPSSAFNMKGRGYPDFATVGHNLAVANNGTFIYVDGTSCSAPVFGGVVSLLNDVRLKNNKPPLGFLNPLFYSIAANTPGAFYDVVLGSNKCGVSDFTPLCCPFGYYAATGWDAVTGLGSPNYEMLAREVLNY